MKANLKDKIQISIKTHKIPPNHQKICTKVSKPETESNSPMVSTPISDYQSDLVKDEDFVNKLKRELSIYSNSPVDLIEIPNWIDKPEEEMELSKKINRMLYSEPSDKNAVENEIEQLFGTLLMTHAPQRPNTDINLANVIDDGLQVFDDSMERIVKQIRNSAGFVEIKSNLLETAQSQVLEYLSELEKVEYLPEMNNSQAYSQDRDNVFNLSHEEPNESFSSIIEDYHSLDIIKSTGEIMTENLKLAKEKESFSVETVECVETELDLSENKVSRAIWKIEGEFDSPLLFDQPWSARAYAPSDSFSDSGVSSDVPQYGSFIIGMRPKPRYELNLTEDHSQISNQRNADSIIQFKNQIQQQLQPISNAVSSLDQNLFNVALINKLNGVLAELKVEAESKLVSPKTKLMPNNRRSIYETVKLKLLRK